MPRSHFGAARELLERAQDELRGSDETSRETRRALDVLIEAVLTAEHSPGKADIIPFPRQGTAQGG